MRDETLSSRSARDATKPKRERAAQKQATYTVTDLVEEYIREALATQKRGREAERLLRKDFLPVFGATAAIDLTRRELLSELIRPKMLRYPRTATQLLCRIRCAYAHAIEQGRVPEDFSSPTVGIKGASQVRRKRVLTDAELATF